MRRLPCLLVPSIVLMIMSAPGCDREESRPEARTAPAAPKEPDSHQKVAADLLSAARDLNAALSGIQSEADAKAAEPKLNELAERHDALAARSRALPPPTKESDAAIRETVQAPLQAESQSIREHLDRFKGSPAILQAVMPHVDRIGQGAQVVAVTSHVAGRSRIKDDPGSRAAMQRGAEVVAQHKDVPIPDGLKNSSNAAQYAMNAAPLLRAHGAAKMAAVRFNQVSTTDKAFLPLIAAAMKSLGLTASIPTVTVTGRTTTDAYVAVAPIDDVNDLAARLKQVIPDATTFVEADKRFVAVVTESSTAAQKKRAAKLAELQGAAAQP